MIKVILFDLDGVLIHHTDLLFSDRLAEKLGIPASDVLEFFEESFENVLLGKADMVETLKPYVKRWGWPGTVQELLDFWFKYEQRLNDELITYIAALHDRGIRCYVATNNEKYRAEAMFRALGYPDVFRKLYASGYLGTMKPDHEFFQKILTDIGDVKRDEVLFWDDTPGHIAAAKAFGLHAEVYTTFDTFKPVMEHYLA